ncbi:MAG: TolC family protein [Bacteroidetes bacterium]|nr:TolC family protein [Bacteroidota bacterium]
MAITLVFFLGMSQLLHAQSSYSLEQCKKLALENNVQVKNGNIEISAAKEVKQAAFTKYFPSISATGMAMRFNDPLIKFDMKGGNLPVYNGDPTTLPFATEFAYFPGFSLSMLDKLTTGVVMATQPVFTGGRIYYGNELARLGMKVSNQKLTLSKNEVLFKTEEQYWLIVSLIEKMKTVDMYNRLLDTLFKDVNTAYKAGLIHHNEVLKVTLKQSEIQMNKLKLENGIKLAMMSLCQHIGVSYDPSLTLSDSVMNYKDPQGFLVNHQQALPSRVEYQLTQDNIYAEKLQSKMKRGEYLPEMAVGVGAFTYDQADTWNNNMVAFGSITIPISNLWEASHSLKERKFKEQVAQNDAANTSELLMLQMEKAWIDLFESFQQILIAKDATVQAEENLKISTDNYHAGISGVSDVLEAQAILQNTYNNLTEARCTYQVKVSSYLQTTGRYE